MGLIFRSKNYIWNHCFGSRLDVSFFLFFFKFFLGTMSNDVLTEIIIGVYHIYQPLRSGRIWHKVIFKRSLTGLNSEFSFSQTSCLTEAEEPSLPYYLPIAGGRIIGFIPFPSALVLCEMCREEENLVFWFGAQFISTLNFTQSGWLILFIPDLHFRLAKRVSGQTQSLSLETVTRTDVRLAVPVWRCFLA